mmetsp:Transcript_35617/g.79175  ORF Transcript_35617/g.79175 Transcript_35617/m.79175 type:complete len:136 (-) Transcript_35617:574-981(-)|eukprot:CAMPEP_0202889610 /NCGR_PEP_ID=MMETSP1392-20130828/201_1 /ASSEMBLY_ACC=CAM_ASM_000868 /TAXON_ID=225041 /ORGANISM="Chlamydomonas chlamydogama, Strain SAG 11-48b" /LENGTH=135 /DNA_ID=CAMNT_0049572983 /DNA_START=105 /DNA_END=512 /DNA_ORIENTATION=+
MADSSKAAFVSVDQLRPGTKGHNIIVKVVEAKVVHSRAKGPKGTPIKVAECIVGDKTGAIVFTARDEQAEQAQPGSYLTLRNAKIEMFRGSMRLTVDKWGKVEVAEGEKFEVKTENNLSLIEFEMVTIPTGEQAP